MVAPRLDARRPSRASQKSAVSGSPAMVGGVLVGAPPRGGAVRSYLADGTLVQWLPPVDAHPDVVRWAVDAEIGSQPVPDALAARTGVCDPARFWPRWTAIEATAKLLDVPVIVWLAEHGLSARSAAGHGIVLHTARHRDLIITVGGRLAPG
jgi:hypothetical protein